MTGDCPTCGRPPEGDVLVAACDVLILRALELVGKRLVRVDRSRYARLGDRPWHDAHLVWQADEAMTDRALRDAWTTVPAVVREHGCCDLTPDELRRVLDRYARDLIAAGRGHDVDELRMRLSAYLGLPTRFDMEAADG